MSPTCFWNKDLRATYRHVKIEAVADSKRTISHGKEYGLENEYLTATNSKGLIFMFSTGREMVDMELVWRIRITICASL